MIVTFIVAISYCCAAIFLGSMLERMSTEEKYRTTERVKMSFWSGFFMSSVIFVPATFLISSLTK